MTSPHKNTAAIVTETQPKGDWSVHGIFAWVRTVRAGPMRISTGCKKRSASVGVGLSSDRYNIEQPTAMSHQL
jgi:hypothetical protein